MSRNGRWLGLSVMAFALALSCTVARADEWDVDVRGGMYLKEAEGPFVGVGGLTRIGTNWFLNPNVEVAFGDDVDFITLNGDVHYDFATSGDVSFWAGGGLAIVRTNPSGPAESETDPGFNAFAGLGRKSGSIRPFGQAKLIHSDETELVIMGGIRF